MARGQSGGISRRTADFAGGLLMNQKVAIVMAAGKGTRMNSDLPKVLVPVCGRPMIDYVLDALEAAGVDRTIVVVGYRAADVQAGLGGPQKHPVRPPAAAVGHRPRGDDVSLRTGRPSRADAGRGRRFAADAAGLAPGAAGRFRPLAAGGLHPRHRLQGQSDRAGPDGPRRASGIFEGIVEEKDATPEQKAIREVNLSCYVFDNQELFWALDQHPRPTTPSGSIISPIVRAF